MCDVLKPPTHEGNTEEQNYGLNRSLSEKIYIFTKL
jgi:hypothetical protein